MRLPVYIIQLQRKIKEEEKGEDLSAEKLSKRLGESVDLIKRVKRIKSAKVSLDKPVREGGDETMLDLANSGENKTEENALKDIREEKLYKLMKKRLTDRERRILKLRYGLENGNTYTLSEIGEEIDLSKERVRQLQKCAINKLKVHEKKLI